jgi:phage terminase large subunit
MRDDILDQTEDGNYAINLSKVIGGGYGNGWFTNCHARYRLYCGARNTKKSYDMIGVEPLIKIMSDELRNVLICRKNDSDLRQSAFE